MPALCSSYKVPAQRQAQTVDGNHLEPYYTLHVRVPTAVGKMCFLVNNSENKEYSKVLCHQESGSEFS
jgi:hypothetical protein